MILSLKENEYISKVECGANHALILTSAGKCYAIGASECGARAKINKPEDEKQNLLIPNQIILANKIIDVFCTAFSSFIKTRGRGKEEKIFSFGLNNFGQLGLNFQSQEPVVVPTLVNLNKNYKIISATGGAEHNLLLCKELGTSQILGAGNNPYGQLSDQLGNNENSFQKINIEAEITNIRARGDLSYCYNSSNIFTFGYSECFCLANLVEDGNQSEPYHVDNNFFGGKKIRQISLGSCFVAALLSNQNTA